MLRVHDRRFFRTKAEEFGVEPGEIVKVRAALDIVRVAQQVGRDTGGKQLFVAQIADRFETRRAACANTRGYRGHRADARPFRRSQSQRSRVQSIVWSSLGCQLVVFELVQALMPESPEGWEFATPQPRPKGLG